MLKNKIIKFSKSSAIKFGILAAGSTLFIGMPCPCCGGSSCALGLASSAATGIFINTSGFFLLSFRNKLKAKKKN